MLLQVVEATIFVPASSGFARVQDSENFHLETLAKLAGIFVGGIGTGFAKFAPVTYNNPDQLQGWTILD